LVRTRSKTVERVVGAQITFIDIGGQQDTIGTFAANFDF